tara:strand:- start:1632 stop:1814 length:183 start_codon:yes stop_codon:yes gene_type:complete
MKKELIKDLPQLLRFIESHDLTPEEKLDKEYISTLIENFYENREKKRKKIIEGLTKILEE